MTTYNKATAEQMSSMGDLKEAGYDISDVQTYIVGDQSMVGGMMSNHPDFKFFEIKENGEIEYCDY